MYRYLKDLVAQFEGIAYVIYNKNANITIDLNGGSIDLEDLNHGTAEEISAQYDKIKEELNKQDSRQ